MMPAGFNQSSIRQHLESHWGLGRQRQAAILCFVVTVQPPSRLSSLEAAKDHLDKVVLRYGAFASVSLLPVTAAGTAVSSGQSVLVDAESINAANKQQNDYLLKQHSVLSQHLNLSNSAVLDRQAESDAIRSALEGQLGQWDREFDDRFFAGIKGIFSTTKIRKYDSCWNWVRADLGSFLNDAQGGNMQFDSVESQDRILRILRRWDKSCEALTSFFLSSVSAEADQELQKMGYELLCRGTLEIGTDPVFTFTSLSTAPKTSVASTGTIEYSEIHRSPADGSRAYYKLVEHGMKVPNAKGRIPHVHLRRRHGEHWSYDKGLTTQLIDSLAIGSELGFSFTGKTALVIGAGPRSIGAEIVQGLLSGGAHVIVTTSRAISDTSKFFKSIYQDYGARGSELTLVPFNQGSKKDCEDLIDHIYGATPGYGGDLDFVVPFAAIPEVGHQMDNLDSSSELAHRMMLVNTLRLLGNVKNQKEKWGLDTRPTNIILPLSPNHGTFGGDGLYSESKLGLETLFNRWHSEDWSKYLTVCGAVIGWTRGTGLMSGNNIVAEAIEASGAFTFSQGEMAFNILALMTPTITSLAEEEPLYADLSGGLQLIGNLKERLTLARKNMFRESKLRKTLLAEKAQHHAALLGSGADLPSATSISRKRANIELDFPVLPAYETAVANLEDLQGMINLQHTVVVVGFSELGPWGNARTRWDMEHRAKLTTETYIEMAWIMGLVKHYNGDIKGSLYVGWVDAKTKEPVHDEDFETKYGDEIAKHSGIRFIEPEGLGGYDPVRKELLHEVAVDDDLPAFEASSSTAQAFKRRHEDKITLTPIEGSEDVKVQVKRGAHFLVPKAVQFDRTVAGQLPKGWNPKNYGIPEEIISQVDPITIYALCCVCEAFLTAGIENPYELYEHIHVSELANCLGTGVGGLLSMRGVYRDRYLDRPVQSDILQESYLNAVGAWTNMLLLASAGPIESPVGTCATAVESFNIGCEAIQSGKVKMALVGGTDDFQEEMSYEFANMKATASTTEQVDAGRSPEEISRPMASSRAGFVESAGCGVQIIMNAELAIKMGLPIHGVVAYTQMAGDKVGRSVPAPGQGILTAAREVSGTTDSPLLSLNYRKRNLRDEIVEIQRWRDSQLVSNARSGGNVDAVNAAADCKIRDAQKMWGNEFRRQDPRIAPIRAALAVWGLTVDDIRVASLHGTSTKANDKNESNVINQQMTHLGRSKGNPLHTICQKYLTGHPKGAAGAWMFNGGLQVLRTGIIPGNRNADNIDSELQKFEHLVYPTKTMHATDVNAFMLTSFGFGQKGGMVIAVAPKFLFAAIRENVYAEYRQRAQHRQRHANNVFVRRLMENRLFQAKAHSPWKPSSESAVFLDPLARVAVVNKDDLHTLSFDPANLHGDLSTDDKDGSSSSSSHRNRDPDVFDFAPIPNDAPSPLSSVASSPPKTPPPTTDTFSAHSEAWLAAALPQHTSSSTVGIDISALGSLNLSNSTFLDRNFTTREQAYCFDAPDPHASFAGRWSAKEAVFKSFGVPSTGPGAAMSEIEVVSGGRDQAPRVEVCASSGEAVLR